MDDLGIPWQTWLALPLIGVLASIYLNLPSAILNFFGGAFTLYTGYVFYVRFLKRKGE